MPRPPKLSYLLSRLAFMGHPVSDHVMNELLERADDARERAYAPYSKFRVGAAVLTAKGNIYTGGNVENASYGVTICAERSAAVAAVAAEGEDVRIVAVAIAGPEGVAAPPCGACRQVISELGADAVVAFPIDEQHTIDELLPFRFDLPR
jgi:cytidine deaminase